MKDWWGKKSYEPRENQRGQTQEFHFKHIHVTESWNFIIQWRHSLLNNFFPAQLTSIGWRQASSNKRQLKLWSEKNRGIQYGITNGEARAVCGGGTISRGELHQPAAAAAAVAHCRPGYGAPDRWRCREAIGRESTEISRHPSSPKF